MIGGHPGIDAYARALIGRLRRTLDWAVPKALHPYWRITRGLTLGVRAVVIDEAGRIFLIRHSYVSGWYLPGGGVEVGETVREALARELAEEGNIELLDNPVLFGVYLQSRVSRRDHICLFVVRSFRQAFPPQPNREIVAHGFFASDALPRDTTPATRARIAEVLYGASRSERW